jgi:hypothetical protein
MNEIHAIVSGLLDGERADPAGCGSVQQRDRLEAVAAWCASNCPGDLVEIGCMNGSTTVRLARVAQAHGRRVLAVDPWLTGTQDCRGGEYENFMQVTVPYRDIVDVVRLPSQEPEAVRRIQERAVCFGFVDGLHTYDACLGDILALAHAAVIAVDDVNWRPDDLRLAFWDGAQKLGRALYWHPLCREGYIL